MPRRNNRDRSFERREYDKNEREDQYASQYSNDKKPVRRRKGKWDKNIYRDRDE